jgi:hypothetical protein
VYSSSSAIYGTPERLPTPESERLTAWVHMHFKYEVENILSCWVPAMILICKSSIFQPLHRGVSIPQISSTLQQRGRHFLDRKRTGCRFWSRAMEVRREISMCPIWLGELPYYSSSQTEYQLQYRPWFNDLTRTGEDDQRRYWAIFPKDGEAEITFGYF